MERAAARHVKVRVRHEGWPPGLHMQLTTQLLILAYELGIFLFELADTQRWWWKRRDLFGRKRKRRLELGHGLLELYIPMAVSDQ